MHVHDPPEEAAPLVSLRVTDGPMRGRSFSFREPDTFVFGRGLDCHMKLPEDDPTASRYHFLLEILPPRARLRDLGSLNGTYVNGVRHGAHGGGALAGSAEIDLQHGDVIRVGAHHFLCEVGMACPQPAAVPAAAVTRLELPPTAAHSPTVYSAPQWLSQQLPADAGQYVDTAHVWPPPASPAPAPATAPGGDLHGPKRSAVVSAPGYCTERLLAEGGMGAVYLVRRESDGAAAAMKVMLAQVAASAHARRLFQREMDVMRALRHPNIVTMLDHGGTDKAFYFVMDFCAGGSVEDLVARAGGRLSVSQSWPIILQMVDGVAFGHQHGFVHRDIKPANILLTEPDGGVAKVTDYGLAKSFQLAGLSGMTVTGGFAGTPRFMPREQLVNYRRVQPATDVWALAATAYYMLTGRTPLDFPDDQDPVAVVLSASPTPIRQCAPNVPAPLARIIDGALEPSPQNRPADAAELKALLHGIGW